MIFSSSLTAIRTLVLATLMVTTCSPFINKAQAQLVLDPGASAAGTGTRPLQAAGQVTPGPATPDGFSPLVFGPDRTIGTFQVKGAPQARATWAGAISLRMHLHNPMPWPLTLDVTLTDAAGKRLTTRLAVPPGPAMTAAIALHPTQPIAWGMRASPPALVEQDNDRLLVATSVDGSIDPAKLRMISLAIPAPDSEQTLRLGKVFYESQRNDERGLYREIIDCHGQFTRMDWPGKRTGGCKPEPSGPGTKDSRTADQGVAGAAAAGSAGSSGPADAYGGLLIPGWPAQSLASGYFRTYRMADHPPDKPGRWLLLTPTGNPFFSLGVNAIQLTNSATIVEGREFMFTDLPAPDAPGAQFYGRLIGQVNRKSGAQRGRGFGQGRTYDFYQANLWRSLGPDYASAWHRRTRERLHDWNFNSIGAWTDESFIAQSKMPFTLIVHIEGDFARLSDGQDWWGGITDPFDPAFTLALEKTLARVTKSYRQSTALIGYFVDNELGWGDGSAKSAKTRWAVVMSVLAMDAVAPDAHARRAFLKWLKERYASPAALGKAWGISLDSWQQLQAPLPASSLDPELNRRLGADLQALSGLLAERYYSLVHSTLKRLDPDHLYLGSRFAARTPEAVHACQLYCDVVSFNLYVPDIRPGFEAASFARFDKPAMLTEFHFGSSDSGPFWPGVMPVPSEQDRAPAYERMLQSVIDNRQFVGAHWFQYSDQPATGRWLDGENGHLGLVDITDSPWKAFTDQVSRINQSMLSQIRSGLTTRSQ